MPICTVYFSSVWGSQRNIRKEKKEVFDKIHLFCVLFCSFLCWLWPISHHLKPSLFCFLFCGFVFWRFSFFFCFFVWKAPKDGHSPTVSEGFSFFCDQTPYSKSFFLVLPLSSLSSSILHFSLSSSTPVQKALFLLLCFSYFFFFLLFPSSFLLLSFDKAS